MASSTSVELPERFDTKQLCFVSRLGEFRELSALISIFGESVVKSANTDLLSSFGCNGEEQVEQGWQMLQNISLSSTFNSWSNVDEGSSGISSKALMSADMAPGAILVIAGLLRRHPDASASGNITLNFSNPQRGRR
jgi:hypothetical protein